MLALFCHYYLITTIIVCLDYCIIYENFVSSKLLLLFLLLVWIPSTKKSTFMLEIATVWVVSLFLTFYFQRRHPPWLGFVLTPIPSILVFQNSHWLICWTFSLSHMHAPLFIVLLPIFLGAILHCSPGYVLTSFSNYIIPAFKSIH